MTGFRRCQSQSVGRLLICCTYWVETNCWGKWVKAQNWYPLYCIVSDSVTNQLRWLVASVVDISCTCHSFDLSWWNIITLDHNRLLMLQAKTIFLVVHNYRMYYRIHICGCSPIIVHKYPRALYPVKGRSLQKLVKCLWFSILFSTETCPQNSLSCGSPLNLTPPVKHHI